MAKRGNLLSVTGSSMYPTLKSGCKVRIIPVAANDINYGDIAVFAKKDLICHRVIGKFGWFKKLYFVHKGDSETIGRVFEKKYLAGKVIEVFDVNGKRVDESIWKRPFGSHLKPGFLWYIYPLLFLAKRSLFGKRQNRFTHWTRKSFWKFYTGNI